MYGLRKGDLVVMTAAGKRLRSRGSQCGVVTSTPRDRKFVNVRRDGLKTASHWWHGFWRLAVKRSVV